MKNKQFIDSKEAFAEATKNQILSTNENDSNFAGNFMYMWTQEGKNYFKNIATRKYGFDHQTILDATKLDS